MPPEMEPGLNLTEELFSQTLSLVTKHEALPTPTSVIYPHLAEASHILDGAWRKI